MLQALPHPPSAELCPRASAFLPHPTYGIRPLRLSLLLLLVFMVLDGAGDKLSLSLEATALSSVSLPAPDCGRDLETWQ